MNVQQKAKGFTIIEVVLVLAIAGLIFLMVFIALPALQSSQRDTARKNDASAVAAAITQYTSNNRGSFPTTTQLTGTSDGKPDSTTEKFGGYVSAVSNNTITIKVGSVGATEVSVAQGDVVVIKGTKCLSTGASNGGTAKQTLASGTSRQFTVITFLEAGGGTSYCQDS